MSQNDQTHFKNLAANAARFLKCVWSFWDIMHKRVNVFQNIEQYFKPLCTPNVISAELL